MSIQRCAWPIALAFVFAAFAARTEAAVRQPDVVPCEPEIVTGEILGLSLRKGDDGTLVQEVRIAPRKVWRGDISASEITVEVPNARPERRAKALLTAGRVYVLFLDHSKTSDRLEVRRDGVFEIVGTTNGPRVVRQEGSTILGNEAFRRPEGLTLNGLAQVIQTVVQGCGDDGGGGGAPPCIQDGGVDDTLYQTNCCSGFAVNGSTVCWNPSDYGNSWASCYQVCGTAPVNGCIPSGGIDDTLGSTSCCSGVAVSGSTWCLRSSDYGTTWASCVQTCA